MIAPLPPPSFFHDPNNTDSKTARGSMDAYISATANLFIFQKRDRQARRTARRSWHAKQAGKKEMVVTYDGNDDAR
ncbi:MAG TPA: hypothetical protein VHA09_03555 [Nitrososphaera sp.]|nr:hypothetical protein [Nitrososphaera sp.]